MKYKIYAEDISASIVVFLVALPLCLGIAIASGTPPVSGLVAGIVGGIVVGIMSNSALGVSGPAAGLVAVCITTIAELGSFEMFLLSVIVAGIFQIIFGTLKGGKLSYFFPSSVIIGMLTAIGIIIILKQLPHAFGYDKDFEGDESFIQADHQNTFTEILYFWKYIHPASTVIFFIGIFIVWLWNGIVSKYFQKLIQIIQAPLVIVILGIILVDALPYLDTGLKIQPEHLVSIPSIKFLINDYQLPQWQYILNYNIWYYGFIIAFIASIETLLSTEATDNLDPLKRITDRNRELIAQGVANIFSGLLGGLPITQVILRSSANINFGAKTKLSAILHGIWLLISVIFLRDIINLIPLSSLATILILVGYKLAQPKIFSTMYNKGWKDFVPFIITIITILFSDLLIGTLTGLLCAIAVQFYLSSKNAIKLSLKENNKWLIEIDDSASFMNKSKLNYVLSNIKNGDSVEIIYKGNDGDIIELIQHKKHTLAAQNINCKIK